MKRIKFFLNAKFWCISISIIGIVMMIIACIPQLNDKASNILISLGGGFVASGILAVLLDFVNTKKRRIERAEMREFLFCRLKNYIFIAISAGYSFIGNYGLINVQDVINNLKFNRTQQLIVDLHRFASTSIEFLCKEINDSFFDKKFALLDNLIIDKEEISIMEKSVVKFDMYIKHMNIDNLLGGIEELCKIEEIKKVLEENMVK